MQDDNNDAGRKRHLVSGGDNEGESVEDPEEKKKEQRRRQKQRKNHRKTESNNEGQTVATADGGHGAGKTKLWWHSPVPHLAVAIEEDLLKVALKWGKTEHGMLKDQPFFRRRDIEKKCKKHRLPMSLACSLRRHHMSLLNPFKSKEKLGLGSAQDIRDAAEVFEQTIAAYLRRNEVQYWDEKEQKRHYLQQNPGSLLQATPDFMMKEPVSLKRYTINKKNGRRHVVEERTVHWIEAKMFYGASTIPLHDKKSAVGSILPKMKKYVELYGEGAIVFMQGCGELLASELAKIGVTALCCTSSDFDLSDVENHQRGWCADAKGNILP